MARFSAPASLPALLFLVALLLAPSSLPPTHAFTLFGSKDDASASQEKDTPATDTQHQGGDGSAASVADLIAGAFHTETGKAGDKPSRDEAGPAQQEGVAGVGVGGEAGQHHSWVDWAKEAAGLGQDTASK